MHFCTARIAIGGDIQNIMTRDIYSPVSWPEIQVIDHIHGEHSVMDVVPIANVEQNSRAERERLRLIYGEEPLSDLWGGRNSPGEMNMPKAKVADGTSWFNPISQRMETSSSRAKDEDDDIPPFGDEEKTTAKKGR